MKEILIDTILDSVKLIPFLFVAFLIIEVVEHKLNKRVVSIVTKKNTGPLFGSLLGLFPQCGFSTLATNLYVTRIISLGTLISIYLSTSDEMLPIMLSSNVDIKLIIMILLIKFSVGLVCGYIIDLIYRKKEKSDYNICDKEHCDCKHGIFKSSLIHTLKTIVYIFIITFIFNYIMDSGFSDYLYNLFNKNSIFSPMLSSLIGLIPNCSSSVIITELYLKNIISFGTLLSGLLTNSGLAILILFKQNKNIKENIFILLLVYLIGIISGIIINLITL